MWNRWILPSRFQDVDDGKPRNPVNAESHATAWLDLPIALQKMSERNPNVSSLYFIAHIMRSLTPLENNHNIQYPLKNWWLMRFSIFKMGSWNQGTKRLGTERGISAENAWPCGPQSMQQPTTSPNVTSQATTWHQTMAHHITTTDIPRKHNQPPRKHHHQTERQKAAAHKKLGLGIALVGGPAHIL